MKPLEGMSVVPDKSFFRPELIVIDVPYSPLETKMRSMAKEVGCKTMNGLGMMLFQGAAAFKLWTGKDMPIEPASFNGPLPDDVQFEYGAHEKVHNIYGHFMAKATYEGLAKNDGGKTSVCTYQGCICRKPEILRWLDRRQSQHLGAYSTFTRAGVQSVSQRTCHVWQRYRRFRK